SAAGAGVGRRGDVRGLTVTNTGSSVTAVREGAGAAAAPSRAGSPAACKDRTYNLEGHSWASGLRYRINLAKLAKRLHRPTVVHQVKVANANMRTGRTTCHRPHLKPPSSHSLGRPTAKPNVRAGTEQTGPQCGAANSSNIVGFANLPDFLLGWTCYWYNTRT